MLMGQPPLVLDELHQFTQLAVQNKLVIQSDPLFAFLEIEYRKWKSSKPNESNPPEKKRPFTNKKEFNATPPPQQQQQQLKL
jgi:hypothetical protein